MFLDFHGNIPNASPYGQLLQGIKIHHVSAVSTTNSLSLSFGCAARACYDAETVKAMQFQFISLAHNLMLLMEDHLKEVWKITNVAEVKRRRNGGQSKKKAPKLNNDSGRKSWNGL